MDAERREEKRMRVVVRTADNPNPTEKYDGRSMDEVESAVEYGGIITNLAPVPIIPNNDASILADIEREGCALEMDRWHDGDVNWCDKAKPKPPLCGTTHCRAGWA